jgi:prepilin peptidase CpaA
MQQVPREIAWLVSFVLVEAAVIDGRTLRVPNWLTFHFAIGGFFYALWTGGSAGVLWALLGAGVGLVTLLPVYAIGGMGAGDVKLMAGVGAWIGPAFTFWAFLWTAMAGGLMGLAMIAYSREIIKHLAMIHVIGHEILAIRNPEVLAQRAKERKPRMLLLPYAIPIATGSIAYFAWAGILI